jgi:amino acid permease
MAADVGSIFSRDEVLGGMPARRASTLLYAIEARTALLSARARRAMANFETERTAAEHEQEFLSALAEGRDSVVATTIQELDRHADRWAGLIPAEPALRAEILRRIVDKYGLPVQATGVRAALGAGDPAVTTAYVERAGKPLAAAGAAPLSTRERLRWWRARASRRLESLPPFWLAFTLTLTETVGGGVLALPIALAGFGPVGATVLLIVFGVLNVLTLAALVESITRDGVMRYGSSFLGRLIGDYLGRPGLAIAIPTILVLDIVGFSVALIGFGTTVGGVTGMPVVLWAAALFMVVATILWRGKLDATVAVAVTVGAVNLALLLGISAIAFLNARPDAFAGSGTGLALDSSVLELIFGVALVAYFGHTSAGHSAKVVLARDPSGRHLLSGNIAAMLTAMVIYILFVFVVTGAVGANALVGYSGTALTPLAQRVGPIIDVLGTVYIVLAVGMSAVHLGLGVYNQMADVIASTPFARIGGRDGIRSAARIADFGLRAAPLLAVFVIVELLLVRGSISFTEPLSVVGTLTLPLLGGVFPMLILVAARRRGERLPGRVIGPLGWPVVAVAIGGVFLFGVLAFGLWIWTGPLQRVAALLVAGAIVALAVASWRRGAFHPRTIVEYRLESGPPDRGVLTIVSDGRSVPAMVNVDETTGRRRETASELVVNAPNRLRSITVDLPRDVAPELRLWVHAIGPDGTSSRLSAHVHVREGDEDVGLQVDDRNHSTMTLRGGDELAQLTISVAPGQAST